MKKIFFKCNSPCFTHLFYYFLLEKEIFRSSKWGHPWDVYGTLWGQNDGKFWGRQRDVGHSCFLNSTQKHIKLTLTGYSRLLTQVTYYSEL